MLVRVVFEMASPVILTDPLHLDAVITAVHPDAVGTTLVRTMDAKGSIKGLPLPLERAGVHGQWVWCASAAYFPDTAKPFSGKYCRRKDEYDADWIGKNVMTIGGIYKNRVAAAQKVADAPKVQTPPGVRDDTASVQKQAFARFYKNPNSTDALAAALAAMD